MARWKNALQSPDEIQRLKRDAVVREAGRAFGKNGYHNTSLDDVAKTLQVSKGTLYNYVRDKQEILFELHKAAGDVGERAFAEARKTEGNGAHVLLTTLEFYIGELLGQLGACSALLEIDALRPEDRVRAVKQRDHFQANLVRMIETGIADGSLRKVNPKLAVFAFMGAINWMPRWFSPAGEMTGEALAKELSALLITGLLPTAPDAPAGTRARATRRARSVDR